MESYHCYELTDFLADERFIGWVLAPDDVSETYWNAVLATHPAIRPIIEEARGVLLTISIKPQQQMSSSELEELVAAVKDHIEHSGTTKRWSTRTFIRYGRWVAAACVLLAVGFVVNYFGKSTIASETDLVIVNEPNGQGATHIANSSNIPLVVLLPDKSTVILDPAASLTYNEHDFRDNRQVYLTGDAFFEVEKQIPKAIFVVNTDYLTAKVLGTSFRIAASGEQSVYRVTVNTGVVEVESKQAAFRVAANEEAVFEVASAALSHEPMVEAAPLSHDVVNKLFDFQSVPLDSVVASLADRYKVSISISDQQLAKRTITASLGELHLYEKLQLISRAAEASYTLNDGKIIISPLKIE